MSKTFKPSDGKRSPARTGYYAGQNGFPINSATGGNCTWYAYGRFCEIAGQWVPMSSKGNAVTFFESFPSCKTGQTPKLGAIACWGYYGSKNGDPGHVAVVEQIKSNGDIVVSNSGWSTGWIGLTNLKKSSNYNLNYNNSVFKGFIYNPITFTSVGEVESIVSDAAEEIQMVNMKQRASKLFSSDNYGYIKKEDKPDPWLLTSAGKFHTMYNSIIHNVMTDLMSKIRDSNVVEDKSLSGIFNKVIDIIKGEALERAKTKVPRDPNAKFNLSKYLVEAPFIEVNFGGYTIGRYDNNLDEYPNYVQSLKVTKINGEINTYNISLVHQIRPGEDPNKIDKLISRNQFNKIRISYGDTSSMQLFEDNGAIISNITMNRDYRAAKITYTIEATSACYFITAHRMNFPTVTDKPSNVLRNLIYNSELSESFKEAFPGMTNQMMSDSKGLIPNNDNVVKIEGMNNVDPITYVNYLVSCMSSSKERNEVIKKSTYFINYSDNANGAYFKITEVKNDGIINLQIPVYEVTVGYPDENNIYEFSVENDLCWSILYDKNLNIDKAPEYVYTIEDNGDIGKYYSPNISKSADLLSEIDKNWWTYMTTFPIGATLKIRGLFKPILLTDYIKINVLFYGQPHITSGIYMITGQQDSLSGNGFKTVLSLTRVGDN